MSHYFENDDSLISNEKEIKFSIHGKEINLLTDFGVFSHNKVDEGSRIFLDVLVSLPIKGRILDVGAGYGTLGLSLALFNKDTHVTLVDVNERALTLSRKNAENLGLKDRVEILQSDVYANIKDVYDIIISNPPIRAGKKVTYQIYKESVEHLSDGGSLYIVIRKKQGAESVRKYLESIFTNVTLLRREKGYHVLRASNDQA